jgi:hypothetical protein
VFATITGIVARRQREKSARRLCLSKSKKKSLPKYRRSDTLHFCGLVLHMASMRRGQASTYVEGQSHFFFRDSHAQGPVWKLICLIRVRFRAKAQ